MNNQQYVYIKTEPGLFTVGFYDPDGKWQPESDFNSSKEASDRVAYLNGARKSDIINKEEVKEIRSSVHTLLNFSNTLWDVGLDKIAYKVHNRASAIGVIIDKIWNKYT